MTLRMNRRDLLRLSAATAGGGLLAACVAPAAAPDESGAGDGRGANRDQTGRRKLGRS